MKRIFLFILFILFCNLSFSQIDLKLYSNFSIHKYSNTIKDKTNQTFITYDLEQIKIFQPSFAIVLNKKNYTHELELSRLGISSDNSTYKFTDSAGFTYTSVGKAKSINLSMRYEITPTSKRPDKKNQFSLSYGVQPFLVFSNTKPENSTFFPIKNLYIGTVAYIAPRYRFNYSDKISFDVNIPINLLEMYLNAYKVENPVLSDSERTGNTINFSMFPAKYNVRFGLVYKL